MTFYFGQTNLYLIKEKPFNDDKLLAFKFLDTDKYFENFKFDNEL